MISELVAEAGRHSYPRIVATLIRVTGDWTLAEDCAQEALAAALEKWPRDGVPGNPGGWLMTVARNRALDVLRRYERWRRFDTWQMGVTTDLLNRLFSNDLGPLRTLRTIGLGIVDRLPRLKRAFIGEAAGFGGALPKLMRGEAL